VVTLHEHRLRIPVDTSFPSGHASSSATMAVLLSERTPFAPLWAGLAVGIGASRVHVGVHHGSDVVAGWAVGVVFGLLGRLSRRRVLATGPKGSGRCRSWAEGRRQ
jgi:undecaprenyl-diphosphatase